MGVDLLLLHYYPPAKHQAIQAESGSQSEQATRAHLAQPAETISRLGTMEGYQTWLDS